MKTARHNVPFDPASWPFFYGWFLMVISLLGFLMTAPGQTYGVSPFTESLIAVLGLTRTQLSYAYMFGTLGSSLILRWAGREYDTYGARIMVPAACLMMGSCLLVMSSIDVITANVANVLGTKSWIVPFMLILLCFLVLRFSGQGVIMLASSNMIMKWFRDKRGIVTGISGMIIAPFFCATPLLLSGLVHKVGWSAAWKILATVCGFGFALVALLFYRDRPEDSGLTPDGNISRKGALEDKPEEEEGFTLQEARKTYSFWVFTLGLSVFTMYMTGLSFHIESIFTAAGMTARDGFAVFLPGAVISVCLRPFVGWLCDRIRLKYMLAFLLLGIGISSLGLAMLAPGWARVLVFVGNGIAGSTFGSLTVMTWPHFYGRKHVGAISGFYMSLSVAGSAVGPLFFSEVLAHTESYSTVGFMTLAACVVFIVASGRADSPQLNDQRTGK